MSTKTTKIFENLANLQREFQDKVKELEAIHERIVNEYCSNGLEPDFYSLYCRLEEAVPNPDDKEDDDWEISDDDEYEETYWESSSED